MRKCLVFAVFIADNKSQINGQEIDENGNGSTGVSWSLTSCTLNKKVAENRKFSFFSLCM